jgi:hypothetical protein
MLIDINLVAKLPQSYRKYHDRITHFCRDPQEAARKRTAWLAGCTSLTTYHEKENLAEVFYHKLFLKQFYTFSGIFWSALATTQSQLELGLRKLLISLKPFFCLVFVSPNYFGIRPQNIKYYCTPGLG